MHARKIQTPLKGCRRQSKDCSDEKKFINQNPHSRLGHRRAEKPTETSRKRKSTSRPPLVSESIEKKNFQLCGNRIKLTHNHRPLSRLLCDLKMKEEAHSQVAADPQCFKPLQSRYKKSSDKIAERVLTHCTPVKTSLHPDIVGLCCSKPSKKFNLSSKKKMVSRQKRIGNCDTPIDIEEESSQNNFSARELSGETRSQPKTYLDDQELFSERVSLSEFQKFFLEVSAKYKDVWPQLSSTCLETGLSKSCSLGYKLLVPKSVKKFEHALLHSLKGLAVFYFDEENYKGNRVVIENLLVADFEAASVLLTGLENFLTSDYNPRPEEIFLKLKHTVVSGEFVPPPKEFTERLRGAGYKWKMVENGLEARFTVLAKKYADVDGSTSCPNDFQLRQVNFMTTDPQVCFMKGRPAESSEFDVKEISQGCEAHFLALGKNAPVNLSEGCGLRDCTHFNRVENSRQLEMLVDKAFRDQKDKNVKKLHFQTESIHRAVCYTTKFSLRLRGLGYTQQIFNKKLVCLTRVPYFFAWEASQWSAEGFLCHTSDPGFRVFVLKAGTARSVEGLKSLLDDFEEAVNAFQAEDEEEIAGHVWVPQFSCASAFSDLQSSDASFLSYFKAEVQFRHALCISDLNFDVAHLDKKIKNDYLFGALSLDAEQGRFSVAFHCFVTKSNFVYCG